MRGSSSQAWQEAREALVRSLEERGLVRDARIAAAMRAVPRHLFVPPSKVGLAYVDTPLPIAGGQVTTAPHLVAEMLAALEVEPGHRVLEVGTGTGYHAALLAELTGPEGEVWTVERIPALAEEARERLAAAGYGDRVHVVLANGSLGLPRVAPFDRIQVAAGGPRIPEALVAQLARGGVLLMPVGPQGHETLTRARMREDGSLAREPLLSVCFVPLVGSEGWPEER